VVSRYPAGDWFRLFRAVSNGGWDPQKYRHSVPTVVLGNQALNAVGYAWVCSAMGPRRPSWPSSATAPPARGERMESFVWAASFNATGRVLPARNNQWAISEPLVAAGQDSPLPPAPKVFGFPGVRVDGNDVLACTSDQARSRKRAGGRWADVD